MVPDLHGVADAGTHRAAAVRITARTAAEVFMVPGATNCRRGTCCLRMLCRDALQLRRALYRKPGQ
jgi:hypothetical protein